MRLKPHVHVKATDLTQLILRCSAQGVYGREHGSLVSLEFPGPAYTRDTGQGDRSSGMRGHARTYTHNARALASSRRRLGWRRGNDRAQDALLLFGLRIYIECGVVPSHAAHGGVVL